MDFWWTEFSNSNYEINPNNPLEYWCYFFFKLKILILSNWQNRVWSLDTYLVCTYILIFSNTTKTMETDINSTNPILNIQIVIYKLTSILGSCRPTTDFKGFGNKKFVGEDATPSALKVNFKNISSCFCILQRAIDIFCFVELRGAALTG